MALSEMVPGIGLGGESLLVYEEVYNQLSLLAAGIQEAGPHLTPATFATGLQGAELPNTGAGSAPLWQAPVGFGPGDHSMLGGDYTVVRYAPDLPSVRPWVDGQLGTWCYLDAGRRFRVGEFPRDAESRVFSGSNRCR